jgi:acetylornithine deacetylase/succinyl-diaminopimelate desuccinylase family protein
VNANTPGADRAALVALLGALVRLPSPNPPGDTTQIAAFVARWLEDAGFTVKRLAPPAKPSALSVVGTIGSGEPVILLHAHIDTVPIAADEAAKWSSDPYAAEIRDGKLYGKGSVDDKAPLAAMLIAAQRLIALPFVGTLVIVAAAEEEVGGQLGTHWLAETGHLPLADFIVVGEQTHNRVATAHKGVLRATVRAVGRSVHATNPDRGVNAIVAMSKAVLALEAYHRELSRRVHPLVGVPTCNVGVIQGGSTANAVPDSCLAYLDRRMIPGEDPEAVKDELRAVIAAVEAAPAALSVGDFLVSNWFSSTCESPLGRAFLDVVHEVLQADPGPIGYLPGSDAKHLRGQVRGETVVFGPGSYEVAHAYDEYVDLDELAATAAILTRFLQRVMR